MSNKKTLLDVNRAASDSSTRINGLLPESQCPYAWSQRRAPNKRIKSVKLMDLFPKLSQIFEGNGRLATQYKMYPSG